MNTTPTIIRVDDLSKRFVLHKDKSVKERLVNFSRSRQNREDFWALRNINLDIHSGTTVGLVGHNGSGKSTLLKAIGGIIQPTSGSIFRRGRLAALLELGAGFHPDLTGRENVYLNAAILGLTRQETDRHFDAIVDFSGIEEFIDTQVKFYSSGMYVRLAFSVAVHVDPDLLLVDEVLAVGDEPFQRKCMDKIAEFQSEGRTIVLVSHSAEQVGQLCDRVVVLQGGSMVHDGNPGEGLRILREGYDASRPKPSAEDRVGTTAPRCVIVDVQARTIAQGPLVSVLIDVTYDVIERTDDLGIGVSIDTTLGMRLYGMTTFPMGVPVPEMPGRYVAQFSLPDLRLGAGSYLINVGIGNNAGVNFDRISAAASFEMPVESFGTGHGILRVSPSLAIITGELE
jgi:ABC-2 type transport system ATP-binding protein